MNEPTWLRRLAEALLSAALAIAPGDALEWGQAMLGELRHVEGNWSAFFWSLGSAGVLAKHALAALIFGANRSRVPSSGDLFAKESPMRKPTLVVIASCTVASLLFFVAPVFRQAFVVSLAQWNDILHVESPLDRHDQELDSLARKGEQNRDAEALAFVAVRHPNEAQRARFVDEAIRVDPNLVWVYATAGMYYRRDFGADWAASLEKWDPQNALPHLIAAQRIGRRVVFTKEFPLGRTLPNPGWDEAMQAAFQSAALDTYIGRQKRLDRNVLARYHISDPLLAPAYEGWSGLPTYASWYSSSYAQSLLERGQTREARGDVKGAMAEYSTIARFGQMLPFESGFFLRKELKEAYVRLEALSKKGGSQAESAFYAALADRLDKAWDAREARLASWSSESFAVSRWNAFLARLSGLLMLFFTALLVLCLLGLLIRNRSIRLAALRTSSLTLALASTSAVGALLSSSVLFVSYWPYSHALQRFVSAGDESGLAQLSYFLCDSQLPLGSGERVGSRYVGAPEIAFYFWFGVAVLCALALAFGVVRYLQTRQRVAAT